MRLAIKTSPNSKSRIPSATMPRASGFIISLSPLCSRLGRRPRHIGGDMENCIPRAMEYQAIIH
jgi:hypothetical protein